MICLESSPENNFKYRKLKVDELDKKATSSKKKNRSNKKAKGKGSGGSGSKSVADGKGKGVAHHSKS